MDDETPEVLDDLRRKRLAYFGTSNSAFNPSTKSVLEQDDHVFSMQEASRRECSRGNDTQGSSLVQGIFNDVNKKEKANTSKTQTEQQSNGSSQKVNQGVYDEIQVESALSTPLKTTSFYLPTPSKAPEDVANKTNGLGHQDRTVFRSVPESLDGMREKGETHDKTDDEGYNETVERLIRATKEELLGMKSKDGIWQDIRKLNHTGSSSVLNNKTEQLNLGHGGKDDNKTSDDHNRSDNTIWRQQRANSESDSHGYLSASLNYVHEAQSLNKPKLFSQTSVPVGGSYKNFEVYPAPSKMEPFHQMHQKDTQDTQKSLNSNTVEELFSSRQMFRSSTLPHCNGNAIGSQEFDARVPVLLNTQQSADFSDLGLSTHRPESDMKDDSFKLEADDINLGDTVTQELRTLLGEEKFQMFLVKSKRDIDDLHDKMSDVSDGSARRDKTPRLLKDRPTPPKKPDTPTTDRKSSRSEEHKETKSNNVLRNKASGIKAEKENRKTQKSNEYKENYSGKSQDCDVVNNLIGTYVLNQNESENKKLATSPSLSTKNKLQNFKDEQKASSPKPVPELNLEALQHDSPRPKLNRPKHEPATIYSEKPKTEHSDRDSFSNASEVKQSPERNYEQVTVPRNVAFSANEIYHQAYGAHYVNQSAHVPVSPSFLDLVQSKTQLPGSDCSVPMTPQTPTGSVAFADLAVYNQRYLGHKPQEQQNYQPVSGVTYHDMPLTPAAPIESSPHMFSSREDSNYLAQSGINVVQHSSTANDMFQVSLSQSSQPYAFPQYSQMYGMMSDVRGYPAGMAPPHAERMAPPTGMTPPTGMMSPRFPVSVMSMDQSMYIPHPPISVAAGHQYNQSTASSAYPGAQGVSMAYSYPYPVMMVTPHPPGEPPATPPTAQPQTPQTSHAEVQTEERTAEAADDKVTLVEESTFTSVSQIKVKDEVMVPHPPSTKKDSRSSPRKPPKVAQASGSGQNNQRHIEGIRQHHEQRRQQQEEVKLSEEQIIEKQRKFAKQSLERYFSSLENLYMPSSKVNSPGAEMQPNHAASYDAAESQAVSDDLLPENERLKQDDGIVEDVLSDANIHKGDNFKMIVPGFVDFREFHNDNDMSKELLKSTVDDEKDNDDKIMETNVAEDTDGETLVNSARTGVSIKAGGLTERLKEVGVDAHAFDEKDEGNKDTHEHSETTGKKHEDKKGKVLIVCPDCKGLNKKYMSWCTHCGEIIIGVEPMLVSKNKQGKIRMKAVSNLDVESQRQTEADVHISMTDGKKDREVHDEEKENVPEKTFTLNLDVMKSPSKESNEGHKASPSKSDGKDSGRPSSEDNDLQNYKIEQEVVNDICESITDPILKDYLKSHFAKKSNAVLDKSQGKAKQLEILLSNSKKKDKVVEDIVVESVRDTNTLKENTIVKLVEEKSSNKNIHVAENLHETIKQSRIFREKEISNIEEVIIDNIDNLPEHYCAENMKHISDVKPELSMQCDQNTPAEATLPNTTLARSGHQGDGWLQSVKVTQSLKMQEGKLNTDKMTVREEETGFIAPPPIPKFSAALPVSGCDPYELRLKIPENSMDFSEDFSQAESMNFDKNNVEEKRKADKKKKEREERRKERRRNRGHGAIDVEVFGYEETRDCRNSSRGLKLVPVLNLCGNSSDEDDMSIQSDCKSDMMCGSKLLPPEGGHQQQSGTAWEPIPESPELRQHLPEVMQKDVSTIGPAGDMSNARLKDMSNSRDISGPLQTNYDKKHEEQGASHSVQDNQLPVGSRQLDSNENLKQLFDSQSPEIDDIPDDPDDTDIPELDQPFLEQVISQSQPKKSKRRPISARNKTVKSVVRQSIEEPGRQRRWARSSTAWSSYNQGELSTQSSFDSGRARPSSAPKVRNHDNRGETKSPFRPASGKQARPLSADLYKRKQMKLKKTKTHETDLDLDPVDDMIEHRLPRPLIMDRLQGVPEAPDPPERMASPSSTYDKYLQMTPRIEAGTVSRWQCLPDEILLHMFAYLDQATLIQCARVCHQYYRVAMDESLWKYITLKKKAQLDDGCLVEVSKRHPVSLALIQCQGDKVTAKGLRDLFRECADSLKELNVGRCSRGALNGDSILLHAAARCHGITHIDTSWCNVTDSGLMAISNCCNRLESLCISGCQAISNDGLETVIKKHGASLRALEMFGCFNIGPRGLRCISNSCINLISVNLGQCYKLTDSCVAQLSSSLGRVETLDLRGLKQIKDNCIRRVVKNCTRLKHLSLANCPNITDVSVLEIATYLTDIRSVDLCGCKNITDSSIRAMVNTCTNLRHIDISSTGCTHRSVSMIANFCGQRLETLKINFLTDVTEQSLIKLAKHCLKLKSVHMYGCTSLRNMDKILHERPTFTIEK